MASTYILVDGVNIIFDDLYDVDSLYQLLYCREFQLEAQLGLLAEDELSLFSDVIILTEKDISTMASGFASII